MRTRASTCMLRNYRMLTPEQRAGVIRRVIERAQAYRARGDPEPVPSGCSAGSGGAPPSPGCTASTTGCSRTSASSRRNRDRGARPSRSHGTRPPRAAQGGLNRRMSDRWQSRLTCSSLSVRSIRNRQEHVADAFGGGPRPARRADRRDRLHRPIPAARAAQARLSPARAAAPPEHDPARIRERGDRRPGAAAEHVGRRSPASMP